MQYLARDPRNNASQHPGHPGPPGPPGWLEPQPPQMPIQPQQPQMRPGPHQMPIMPRGPVFGEGGYGGGYNEGGEYGRTPAPPMGPPPQMPGPGQQYDLTLQPGFTPPQMPPREGEGQNYIPPWMQPGFTPPPEWYEPQQPQMPPQMPPPPGGMVGGEAPGLPFIPGNQGPGPGPFPPPGDPSWNNPSL